MPERENVAGGVHVPVVYGTALIADPLPHSKRTHTFRTAGGNTPAARASLGGESLVDLFEDDACVIAFVRQHRLEHPPARVESRLGVAGLRHGL